jgi:hypothetical protein
MWHTIHLRILLLGFVALQTLINVRYTNMNHYPYESLLTKSRVIRLCIFLMWSVLPLTIPISFHQSYLP